MDSFITDLHALAAHCEYKDLHDEMIRDRIIVGLRDAFLSVEEARRSPKCQSVLYTKEKVEEGKLLKAQGGEDHQQCPAKKAVCNKCEKQEHFKRANQPK